ncbi:MAG: CinA family protein [Oxalobacteraceae bacterium]|jgi:nicotinamide-nucleotide amidase|nr:CinA family protein [Oxalobacteraceae bacterium]
MDTLNQLAIEVGKVLQQRGWFLATAESITGGSISQAITDIAGSSGWFDCGFVTYSNGSKTKFLNVSEALIAQHGAVSEEVAAEMAKGTLDNTDAHITLSTTGIAGPAGAVPGKPVGTVCFGWAHSTLVHTERAVFSGDRHSVRTQTTEHALKGLLKFIERIK